MNTQPEVLTVEEIEAFRKGQKVFVSEMYHSSIDAICDLALKGIEAEGWHPIETAPKDGTPILVCRWPATTNTPVDAVRWVRDRQAPFGRRMWGIKGHERKELRYDPTHWRSLPTLQKPEPAQVLTVDALISYYDSCFGNQDETISMKREQWKIISAAVRKGIEEREQIVFYLRSKFEEWEGAARTDTGFALSALTTAIIDIENGKHEAQKPEPSPSVEGREMLSARDIAVLGDQRIGIGPDGPIMPSTEAVDVEGELRARVQCFHKGTCTKYYDTDADLDTRAAGQLASQVKLTEAQATQNEILKGEVHALSAQVQRLENVIAETIGWLEGGSLSKDDPLYERLRAALGEG